MKAAVLFVAAGLVIVSAPAGADVSEAAIVNAMRAVGAAWGRIAETGEPFISNCPDGGYAGFRLAPGSRVSFDLQKTGSLLNPYVGIVNISGSFQTNGSQEDGSCRRTLEAARQSTAFWGNDWTYSFQLVYQINGTTLAWTNADAVFMRGGGNALTRINQVSARDWFAAIAVPL